jgi:cbb3-type cytochrome oxidase maturation FixS-like protein
MEVTWIAILASLCMGIGAALVFVFAVKKHYFENLEDAKYHVFWSDLQEKVDSQHAEKDNDDEEGDQIRG